MAVDRLQVDAAIIFSDLLLILLPMGIDLEYSKGEGPVIHRPVRSGKDVDVLSDAEPESLQYVYDAIRIARRSLAPEIPLIGFAGLPFTLASYVIEGGGSRTYQYTKMMMYRDPGAWHALLDKLSRAIVGYVNEQISAGAQAIQLFDSWVGCLSPDDYREFVLPHYKFVFENIAPGAPIIHFGTGTSSLLELMKVAGGDVIGLDWRVDLAEAWSSLGDVAVQGNLDPIVLFAKPREIRKRAEEILRKAAERPGHIFNLGHGILPGTPVEHVIELIDAVHEMSQRSCY
jgi:uroporphyrinogen decarboxylase